MAGVRAREVPLRPTRVREHPKRRRRASPPFQGAKRQQHLVEYADVLLEGTGIFFYQTALYTHRAVVHTAVDTFLDTQKVYMYMRTI